jgi:5'-3' exonuclease
VRRANELYKIFQQERDPYIEDVSNELWKSPALRLYFAAEHLRELGRNVGIPVLTAPSEAELYAAVLCRDGAVDTVVSNDADAILFGSPHVTKQMQLSNEKILRVTQSDFEQSLHLDLEYLRDLAIVTGCDFHKAGVKGIGPRRGAVLLQKHGGLEGLLKARGFVASERIEYIEAREVFDEASYLSANKLEFKLNPPLVPKVLRSLETIMPTERAELTTQKIVSLWRTFGNRQQTLEQWL